MEQESIRIIGDAKAYADIDVKKHTTFNKTFQSLGGFCMITAGILAGIAMGFRPDIKVPGSVLLASWYPVHLALLMAFTLSVPGIIGIFSYLKNETGVVNQLAYIMGLVGAVWSVAIVVIEMFVLPGIAAREEIQMPMMDMMAIGSSLETLKPFFFAAYFVWIGGWVLIGFSLAMSHKLPTYIGVMLIVSVLLMSALTMAGFNSGMVHIVMGLLLGASWVLIGNSIRKYDAPF